MKSVVDRYLHWIVSPSASMDPELLRRMQLFGTLCTILMVIGLIRVIAFILIEDYVMGLLYCALPGMGLLMLSLVRRGVSLNALFNILFSFLFVVFTMVAVRRGGIGATILGTYAIIPLVSIYVLGVKSGARWWALSVVSLILMATLEGYGVVHWTDTYASQALVVDAVIAILLPTAGYVVGTVFEVSRVAAAERVVREQHERASAEANLVLMKADKMASVGLLAAGVGHEINNPLAYAQANIDYVLDDIRSSGSGHEELLEPLLDARDGLVRIAKITQDLRTFSRMDNDSPVTVVNLAQVVNAAINLTHREISERAQLHNEMVPCPDVEGVESKLVQVVVNLMINSSHAVSAGDGGKVLVRSGYDERSVWLEVADNGPGVEPEYRDRIFDPFFTTKALKQGNGLGLSVSLSIVKSLKGELELLSTPEAGGATFRMTLPRVAAGAGAQPDPEDLQWVQGARILLVDDEPLIRKSFIKRMKGHTIVVCASGAEALEKMAEDSHFDLVLCDVMMSPMNGMEFLAELRRAFPEDMPAFAFMTGGVFSADARARLKDAGVTVLYKPVSMADINAQLQGVMTTKQGSPQ